MASATSGLSLLEPLVGCWEGAGAGSYPTVPAFTYRERLTFEDGGEEPLVHFIQRTWRTGVAGEQPLHWESGFILALPDGGYQLVNSQNGGRVEVMAGSAEVGPLGEVVFAFASTLFGNDGRLLATARRFELSPATLSYTVQMATHRNPVLTHHLAATLGRASRRTP